VSLRVDPHVKACRNISAPTGRRRGAVALLDEAICYKPSVSRLSRNCGSLDVSQPYGPSRPVIGIALPFTSQEVESPLTSPQSITLLTGLCGLVKNNHEINASIVKNNLI
jgi:hypothetical protein